MIKPKVFNHKRNRTRQVPVGGAPLEVSEAFYSSGLTLTQVAYTAINLAYPKADRDASIDIAHKHRDVSNVAKQHLTYHKCIVRDDVVPLALLKKHKEPYDFHLSDFTEEGATQLWEDKPTYQFRALVVLNNFYMLYMRLKNYASFFLPAEQIDSYLKVLDATYKYEREKLLHFLAYYEAVPVLRAEDFE